MFYTPSTITISEGETITGTLSCAPNTRNNRDLDIGLSWMAPDGTETKFDYKMCEILPIPFYQFSILNENADRWSGRDITTPSARLHGFPFRRITDISKLCYIDDDVATTGTNIDIFTIC